MCVCGGACKQTQRSIHNFPIGGPESKMPLQVVHAFGAIKKCVAQYNEANGKLDAKLVRD
jgi:fumarate hydratase class II